MYFLCSMEPSVFVARAPRNLQVLSSEEVREMTQDLHREFYSFGYPRDGEISGDFRAVARRRDLPGDQRHFWQAAYRFAASVGGGPLDEVVQRFRKPAAASD